MCIPSRPAFGALTVADTGTATLSPRSPGAWNATWTDRLKKDLLSSYDKFARPAQHTNTTVVSMHVTFRHIDLVGLLTSLPQQYAVITEQPIRVELNVYQRINYAALIHTNILLHPTLHKHFCIRWPSSGL
jgi:hypothetical protein